MLILNDVCIGAIILASNKTYYIKQTFIKLLMLYTILAILIEISPTGLLNDILCKIIHHVGLQYEAKIEPKIVPKIVSWLSLRLHRQKRQYFDFHRCR